MFGSFWDWCLWLFLLFKLCWFDCSELIFLEIWFDVLIFGESIIWLKWIWLSEFYLLVLGFLCFFVCIVVYWNVCFGCCYFLVIWSVFGSLFWDMLKFWKSCIKRFCWELLSECFNWFLMMLCCCFVKIVDFIYLFINLVIVGFIVWV